MKCLISCFSTAVLITFLAVIQCGCYVAGQQARYDIRLAEVQRPADAKERYGEQLIEKRQAQGDSLKYWFEDKMVSILWVPTTTRVNFLITNKTEHSVKILWDESAFVMPNGTSRRVVHNGVKYSEVNNSQPPSVIARGGMLNDFIVSADQCVNLGVDGGWYEAAFLPKSPDAAAVQTLKGMTFSILLPLQIDGVTNEYQFSFSIDDVVLPPPPKY